MWKISAGIILTCVVILILLWIYNRGEAKTVSLLRAELERTLKMQNDTLEVLREVMYKSEKEWLKLRTEVKELTERYKEGKMTTEEVKEVYIPKLLEALQKAEEHIGHIRQYQAVLEQKVNTLRLQVETERMISSLQWRRGFTTGIVVGLVAVAIIILLVK